MALITCPKCGKQVSDKAEKCIHCGYVFHESNQENSVNNILQRDIPSEMTMEKNENSTKKSMSTKKLVVFSIVALLAVIMIVFGIIQVKKKKQADEYQTMLSQYYSDMDTANYKMLMGCSIAEQKGNLIKSVWNNAIYEKKDIETDSYTRPAGYFVDDFNEALANLFADEDFNNSIEEIKSNQEEVENLMKSLRNPPKEYEDAYDALKEFYTEYQKFTSMVIDPSGSLSSFSSEFNTEDTEVMSKYNAMKLYID